jgi:hypothetical protein
MSDVVEQLEWLATAGPEDIDRALAAGELDALLARRGPGEVTGQRARLVEMIGQHFPKLDLEQRICRWRTLDDERPALEVDGGSVVFVASGEDLHVVGPVPGGAIRAFVIAPSGEITADAEVPDPHVAQAERAHFN